MQIVAFLISGFASMFYPEQFTPTIRTSSPYQCAMNYVRPGTHVYVVNDENGRESHCIITGSGPFYGGRILDASPAVAHELGYSGTAHVRVYRVTGYLPKCVIRSESSHCILAPDRCVLPLPHPSIEECS